MSVKHQVLVRFHLFPLASLAQLAEQWYCKPQVEGSLPSGSSMTTFKYNNQIITTPNLEKKLKRMKLTLEDIEIIPENTLDVKKEEKEDNWKRPLVYLKSTLDNSVYTIYSEEKPENPIELVRHLIWNMYTRTGVEGFTEEYAKTLVYVNE